VRKNSNTESPREKEKREKKRKERITGIIIAVILIPVGFIFFFTNSEDVTISEDRINIYLHLDGTSALLARIAGGYEVRFDDIADIELLPYSANQLGDRIENLNVPPLTYRASWGARVTAAGYDSGFTGDRNHRIHISLYPDAAPTIWITRHENAPVLLSFRYGYETEALYERIVTAWEQWQAS